MLICTAESAQVWADKLGLTLNADQSLSLLTAKGIGYTLHFCHEENQVWRLFETTGPLVYTAALSNHLPKDPRLGPWASEAAIAEAAHWPYLSPELRDHPLAALGHAPPSDLLVLSDIKGVIHAHSRYSDGAADLEAMAEACKARGYHYLLITDHSQSAFYANGLKPERVKAQWAEIDAYNARQNGFKIYKGIESDILASGELDYEAGLLQGFDLVIASVHSQLNMSKDKAMERLLKAIANPYTRILGHPTGRLLGAREGYPLDMPEIIDACAKYGVAIELNAHPYRLDLDWTWLPLAQERGVKIAINPDAHSIEGLDLLRYGVETARKGWLSRANLFELNIT